MPTPVMEFIPCVLVAQGPICMRPFAHTLSSSSLKREDKNVFGNFLSLGFMQCPEVVTAAVRNIYFHQTSQFVLRKGKGLPQQAEVSQGVPGSLRPRVLLTFGTTRVVGRQPYAPAAFTPREIPGTHF